MGKKRKHPEEGDCPIASKLVAAIREQAPGQGWEPQGRHRWSGRIGGGAEDGGENSRLVQRNVVPNTRGPMDDLDSEWQRKGATLSDKTARREFGLTQEEIVRAIRAAKLHYRVNSIFGNPFLRLLRREVEALVKEKHGADYLKAQQAKTEVAGINRELKQLRTRIAALEEQKSQLTADSARRRSHP